MGTDLLWKSNFLWNKTFKCKIHILESPPTSSDCGEHLNNPLSSFLHGDVIRMGSKNSHSDLPLCRIDKIFGTTGDINCLPTSRPLVGTPH